METEDTARTAKKRKQNKTKQRQTISASKPCTHRLIQFSGVHKPPERRWNSLYADLVEREAHDAVELTHDERQSKALRVVYLHRIGPGLD